MKNPKVLWQEYAKAVYPDGVHPDQERECRQAFLSGMLTLLAEMMMEASSNEGSEDSAADAMTEFYEGLRGEMTVQG